MFGLDKDILIYISIFLDDRSLCRWSQTCKFIYSSEKFFTDTAWKQLCEKRWLNFRNILRSSGASSYKEAFQILSASKFAPRGKYTEKRSQVFGYGCNDGVSAWIFIDHSIDCKPRLNTVKGTLERVITLKVCLQNIGHDQVTLGNIAHVEDFRSHRHSKSYDAVEVYLKGTSSIDISNRANLFNVALKAINGEDVTRMPVERIGQFRTSYGGVYFDYSNFKTLDINMPSLSYLDSIVFSTDVQCSEDVENEVDFLCSIQHISLYCNCVQSIPQTIQRNVRVDCKIIDEDEVWKHYLPLQRGLVVLREDTKPYGHFGSRMSI
jgi:hypothetical protein